MGFAPARAPLASQRLGGRRRGARQIGGRPLEYQRSAGGPGRAQARSPSRRAARPRASARRRPPCAPAPRGVERLEQPPDVASMEAAGRLVEEDERPPANRRARARARAGGASARPRQDIGALAQTHISQSQRNRRRERARNLGNRLEIPRRLLDRERHPLRDVAPFPAHRERGRREAGPPHTSHSTVVDSNNSRSRVRKPRPAHASQRPASAAASPSRLRQPLRLAEKWEASNPRARASSVAAKSSRSCDATPRMLAGVERAFGAGSFGPTARRRSNPSRPSTRRWGRSASAPVDSPASARRAAAPSVPNTNDDFPEPETPHTTLTAPMGNRTSIDFRLWPRAPRTTSHFASLGIAAIQGAAARAPRAARSAPVGDSAHAAISLGFPAITTFPPALPAPGPSSTTKSEGADRLQVVLHQQYGVPCIAQRVEARKQTIAIRRMAADRRLVEDEERAADGRANRRGAARPLALAGREAGGAALKVHSAEPQVTERAEPRRDLGAELPRRGSIGNPDFQGPREKLRHFPTFQIGEVLPGEADAPPRAQRPLRRTHRTSPRAPCNLGIGPAATRRPAGAAPPPGDRRRSGRRNGRWRSGTARRRLRTRPARAEGDRLLDVLAEAREVLAARHEAIHDRVRGRDSARQLERLVDPDLVERCFVGIGRSGRQERAGDP